MASAPRPRSWLAATALAFGLAAALTSCEREAPSTAPASASEGQGGSASAPIAEPEPDPIAPTGTPDEVAPSPADAGGDADPPGEGKLVVGEDPCESDADCVPQQCCHATTCGAPENAESCDGGTMCTMDCRADTMDCGGGCLCHEGKCAARLWAMPAPE